MWYVRNAQGAEKRSQIQSPLKQGTAFSPGITPHSVPNKTGHHDPEPLCTMLREIFPIVVNTYASYPIGATPDRAAMQRSSNPFLLTVRWSRTASVLKPARAARDMMD